MNKKCDNRMTIYDTYQAAEKLSITEDEFIRLCDSGDMPAFRDSITGNYYISKNNLDCIKEAKRRGGIRVNNDTISPSTSIAVMDDDEEEEVTIENPQQIVDMFDDSTMKDIISKLTNLSNKVTITTLTFYL